MANSEGVKYSKMVDMWALGIILYHTVYDTLPFSGVPGKYYLKSESILHRVKNFFYQEVKMEESEQPQALISQ